MIANECMAVNRHLEDVVREFAGCIVSHSAAGTMKLSTLQAQSLTNCWSNLHHDQFTADNAHLTVPRGCGSTGNLGEVLSSLQRSLTVVQQSISAGRHRADLASAEAKADISVMALQLQDLRRSLSVPAASLSATSFSLQDKSPVASATASPTSRSLPRETMDVGGVENPPTVDAVPFNSLLELRGAGAAPSLKDRLAIDVVMGTLTAAGYSDTDRARINLTSEIFLGMANDAEREQLQRAPCTASGSVVSDGVSKISWLAQVLALK